jgi:hypothetical protein
MTIKQQGGVFGRNPTFNDVTIDGAINAPTTGSTGLVISGGTQSGTANALSGELRIGENPVYQGRIYYDYNTGDFYIENSYNNNNGEIIFRTKTNATPVEVGRFNQNGLAFPNGKGIDFSATAGTGTSELFDDYEEGTWTPTYTTDGTDFDSITYDAVTSGNYTKIGNLVTLVARIRTDAITVGSASGSLVVGGLPFTPSANFGSASVYASAFAASEPRVLTPATAGTLYLYKRTAADGADTIMTAAEAGTGANQNLMYFTVSYQTA